MKNINIENIKENVEKLIKAYAKNKGKAIVAEKENIEIIAGAFFNFLQDLEKWEKEGVEDIKKEFTLVDYYGKSSCDLWEEYHDAQCGLWEEKVEFRFEKERDIKIIEMGFEGVLGGCMGIDCPVSICFRKMEEKTDLFLHVGSCASIYIDGGKVKYAFE